MRAVDEAGKKDCSAAEAAKPLRGSMADTPAADDAITTTSND
jgi:hypothetical protein